MKKYIFLLLTIFMLTGCSSIVNLKIDENSITENIKVNAKSLTEYNEIKNWSGFPLPLYIDQDLENPWSNEEKSGIPYYDVVFNDDELTAEVSGNFSKNNHIKSSIINNCFDNYNIVLGDGGSTIFSTSRGLICKFKDFSLVVNTPYLVLSNNATSIDESTNTYTWIINESNFDVVSVYLEIDFSSKYNEFDSNLEDIENNIDNSDVVNNNDKSNGAILLLLIGGCILSLLFCGLYLKKKKDKNSAI